MILTTRHFRRQQKANMQPNKYATNREREQIERGTITTLSAPFEISFLQLIDNTWHTTQILQEPNCPKFANVLRRCWVELGLLPYRASIVNPNVERIIREEMSK